MESRYIKIFSEDLNDILSQKAARFAFQYKNVATSGPDSKTARQTPETPVLEAKPLRRSGQNIVGRRIMIYIVTVLGTLLLLYG